LSTSTYDPRTSGSTPHGQTTTETTGWVNTGPHTHRRISWAAIFGGVILVITVQLLLSLLGAGIGLGIVDVNGGATPSSSTLGIGAGLWWVVSSCIALFAGGYAAAWFAGIDSRFDGVLHGIVTWGIATLVTFWLLTSAIGSIIGGGFSALSTIVSTAGSGVGEAAKPLAQAAGVTPDVIQDQAQAFLRPTNPDPATMSPQDAQKAVATNLATYIKGGPDAPAAKERTIDIMAAQMKVSREEATNRFNDAEAKLKQTRDQAAAIAKNTADATAAAASKTSFSAFGVLLVGMIAAAIGGSMAIQRRLLVARRTTTTGGGSAVAAG